MSKTKKIISQILKAVGLGMGIACVVLPILNALTPEAGVPMLGIGLLAISLSALQQDTK